VGVSRIDVAINKVEAKIEAFQEVLKELKSSRHKKSKTVTKKPNKTLTNGGSDGSN